MPGRGKGGDDYPERELTQAIIGALIEVHKHLGPGLLESAYQKCFCRELTLRGIPYECERNIPINYKGVELDCGYRLDVLVHGRVLVEIKSVETLTAVHTAQLLTYMRLLGIRVGLLVNFNVPVLKEGIRRLVL